LVCVRNLDKLEIRLEIWINNNFDKYMYYIEELYVLNEKSPEAL